VRATTQQGRYQFLANLNNIHTTRTWDTRIPIGGTVATNARVVVNDIGTWRKDGWFHAEIPVDNANGPVYQDIRVYAAVYDPTLQTDVVTVASGKVSVAQLMETPGYDNKCALVSDSRRQFVYNAFGWLLEAQNAGVEPHLKANYSYYPDGRRARKIVCEWDGSTWVTQRVDQFYYEGWHLVAETRTSGSTQTVYRYTWGLDVAGIRSGEYGPEAGGIGGLLAITEVRGTETNVYFPVADHNGNIHSLIDATSGVTVANYEYDPYGVLVGETGDRPDRCSLRFQSKYFDRETGLYYYGYRYYDPLTTKWLTRDPLGERGGVNLTAFCEGDPVNQVDPDGRLHRENNPGVWDNSTDYGLMVADSWAEIPRAMACNVFDIIAWGVENSVAAPGRKIAGKAGDTLIEVAELPSVVALSDFQTSLGPLAFAPGPKQFTMAMGLLAVLKEDSVAAKLLSTVAKVERAVVADQRAIKILKGESSSIDQLLSMMDDIVKRPKLSAKYAETPKEIKWLRDLDGNPVRGKWSVSEEGFHTIRIQIGENKATAFHEYLHYALNKRGITVANEELFIEKFLYRHRNLLGLNDSEVDDVLRQIQHLEAKQ